MIGPCMCGAWDCPRCYPGCNTPEECERCGRTFKRVDLTDDGLCEECASKQMCQNCGEYFEPEELNENQYCAKCAIKEAIEDATENVAPG